MHPDEGWPSWRAAWQQALYGPDGFYRRPEGPAGHFRTATHAAPRELAAALTRLARRHGCSAVVDVGAGRGELLTALAGSGLRRHGVDVVARPPSLPAGIGWSAGVDAVAPGAWAGALVVGWELLDVVPCEVLELDADGAPRRVLVQPATGRERLGERVDDAWRARWWPGGEEGDRVEVGTPRDELWAGLLARAQAGGARLGLAVDYAHTRENRPPEGSLTGFRAGRAVPPRPDGSMDVTAHVAIDAVAAATDAATGRTSSRTTQREALLALGVTDAELLDPGSLGGFAWLESSLV
ncbi:SAM-dependent methyltransferase [Spongisporangium articulatum]|uniref:SAM-dependent methyltransferase n=1 Tax=Spongisporangium articulatum TaxID=3362603 RepID=A0ABW8ANG5_9ACTN